MQQLTINRCPLVEWIKAGNNHRIIKVSERWQIEGKDTEIYGFLKKEAAVNFLNKYFNA